MNPECLKLFNFGILKIGLKKNYNFVVLNLN